MANGAKKKRLGEILIEEGVINDLQLATALGDQKQWGGKIGEILLRLKMMTEDDLAFALQTRLKVKWLSLKEMTIQEAIIKLVPEETAKQFMVVPVGIKKTTLYIAMTDPTDLKTLDTLSFNLGMMIKPVIATLTDIKWAIARYYDKTIPDEEVKAVHAEARQASYESKDEPIPDEEMSDAQTEAMQAASGGKVKAKGADLQKRMERKQFENNLKGLVALLIEKGLITQEELAEKIADFDL